jgi:hypothetical protein
MQFTDLIKLLDAHYDDIFNIMTATYDFYSCVQKDGQCGFKTSILATKSQDRALRDMYVIDIWSQKIRQIQDMITRKYIGSDFLFHLYVSDNVLNKK